MSDYCVTLTYPVTETIDGLGEVHTTVTERNYYPTQAEAFAEWKAACRRLPGLGLFAQADLISNGTVTGTKANLPDAALEHPLVTDMLDKLRAQGRRP